MHHQIDYLLQFHQRARQHFQRGGVVLRGAPDWQSALITSLYHQSLDQRWFCLGDWELDGAVCVSPKQGQQLLGRECDVLVYDAREQFDANSFAAVLGTLVGGGMLIVLLAQPSQQTPAQQWMECHWQRLTSLEQGAPLPALPHWSHCRSQTTFAQQQYAVERVVKVVTGHRKRPFVLTADRGRGKSSALGIACGQLLEQRPLRILVTAPCRKSVDPVFAHARGTITQAVSQTKDRLQTGQGYLQFIAPDELLSAQPDCDLLLVDEAAAIPVPMLQRITKRYHRLVFSSTVHGYEGCGRGFTLKFVAWLRQNRPGMHEYHIQQPIRWDQNDGLEAWMYAAFLLDSELAPQPEPRPAPLQLSKMSKAALIEQPQLMRSCFALLVNAHYQTAPNDLLQLLDDPCCHLYLASVGENHVGVIMAVEEGRLDAALIEAIQSGKRRPKGHLAPTTIVNHLGYASAGEQSSLRVMRIAVHPQWQGKGVGSEMLSLLDAQLPAEVDYLSTSFGATAELLRFWSQAGYYPIRLGTARDAASGCYSLMMTCSRSARASVWMVPCQQLFQEFIRLGCADTYPQLETPLLRELLKGFMPQAVSPAKLRLIQSYANGGVSFESIWPWLKQWLMGCPAEDLSDLLLDKVMMGLDWQACAQCYALTGRKQIEKTLRAEIKRLAG
ncbi:GNAT family N-acetyltransferase [Vibrio sp. CAU 1672]|uniref:tRNA(Met) cytidine acetyltransferase TmcA n=1 Tax=Vibrio sp. CAU 1672 TaxID=3032594 RepID=UPI0023D9E6F1|nr:GNAT family N-acetyltransferase [Vibrio sp. CAU 1672]MDF2153115.1 GNAT family N-acetyltransferase [Vibrio sp. CAU 1672]